MQAQFFARKEEEPEPVFAKDGRTQRLSPPIMRRKRNPARPVRAVAPRMIAAALHDGVAGLEMHFFLVEHQRDFAFEDQAEVERARFLHIGVGCFG